MKIKDILESINENYKNEDEIQVKTIFIFENGNVAVCDNNGKQIPFLQGILGNSNIKQPIEINHRPLQLMGITIKATDKMPKPKENLIKNILSVFWPPVKVPAPLPITRDQRTVLMFFNRALRNGSCHVNFYYEPLTIALRQLVNRGTLKKIEHRGMFLGYEYNNNLFNIVNGALILKGVLI